MQPGPAEVFRKGKKRGGGGPREKSNQSRLYHGGGGGGKKDLFVSTGSRGGELLKGRGGIRHHRRGGPGRGT